MCSVICTVISGKHAGNLCHTVKTSVKIDNNIRYCIKDFLYEYFTAVLTAFLILRCVLTLTKVSEK